MCKPPSIDHFFLYFLNKNQENGYSEKTNKFRNFPMPRNKYMTRRTYNDKINRIASKPM